MRKYSFWKKLSNISAYTGGFFAIVHTFFRNYIESILVIFIIVEVNTIALFLISEMAKLWIKKDKN